MQLHDGVDVACVADADFASGRLVGEEPRRVTHGEDVAAAKAQIGEGFGQLWQGYALRIVLYDAVADVWFRQFAIETREQAGLIIRFGLECQSISWNMKVPAEWLAVLDAADDDADNSSGLLENESGVACAQQDL